MTMTLKDVKPGMCWRFTRDRAPNKAPDFTPTYSLTLKEQREGRLETPIPEGWDEHNVEDNEEFNDAYANQPVQLLTHYSADATGSPLKDYTAVPTRQVKCGQWYLGTWNEASAKAVAASLNNLSVSPTSYHSSHGPIIVDGWAVVRSATMFEQAPASDAPRVLSCVDPHADLANEVLRLTKIRVDGLLGSECLARFELAQRTESLARPRRDVDHLVSTNADCGLTIAQVEHARLLWDATLRLKVARSRAEAAERERTRVVVDHGDD